MSNIHDMIISLMDSQTRQVASLSREHVETLRGINRLERDRRSPVCEERDFVRLTSDLMDLRKHLAYLSGKIQALNEDIKSERLIVEEMRNENHE